MGKHVAVTGQLGPRTAKGTALASLENAARAAGLLGTEPSGQPARAGGHRARGAVLRWRFVGPRQAPRRAAQ